MNQPKLSVITVCYNCRDFLERTILSYISQTFKDKELIVIDGGSRDGCLDIIKKYESYISKWISEPDEGIYDAMNKGITLAKGEWVNFMNAGDIYAEKDTLCKAFSVELYAKTTFIYSDFLELIDAKGNFVLRNADRHKGMINHQSSIYKKELHDKYGYYQYKKPYKVYDLMFFLSIPENEFQKINFPISKSDNTGVSNINSWCFEQAQCLRAAYGIINIHQAYKRFWFQKINSMLPGVIKFIIDKYIRKNKIYK